MCVSGLCSVVRVPFCEVRRSRMSSNAFSATITSGEGLKEISISQSPNGTRVSIRRKSKGAATRPPNNVTRNTQHVIDIGCGSGILSIAALKLGANKVLGVDIDIESVKNSRENADTNGVGDELMLGQGSVAEVLSGKFQIKSAPLVVANILAPIIIRLFDAGLADLVEPNGEIILSGILAHQAENVIEAGQAKGLKRSDQRQIGDWVALTMLRDV